MRILLVVLCLCFLLGSPGLAQSVESTITVAPAIFDAPVNAGETTNVFLIVQNGGKQALPVSFAIESLFSSSLRREGTQLRDAKSWITIENPVVVFEPQERKKIPLTITTPVDAEAGGYYALISVRGLSLESQNKETSSIVIPEVTVAVFITVAGELDESVRIVTSNILPIQTGRNDKRQLAIEIENTGNVHGLVSPELLLIGDDGEKAMKLGSKIILPGSSEVFMYEWETPPEYGLYSAHIRFPYGSEGTLTESPKERVYVTPSIRSLLALGGFVWISMYALHHRKQIKPAMNILIKGNH